MGYQSSYVALELFDGRKGILVLMGGTSSSGSDAPRDTSARREAVGLCVCGARATHIAPAPLTSRDTSAPLTSQRARYLRARATHIGAPIIFSIGADFWLKS